MKLIVNSFAESVIAQTSAIERGDYATGNKFAKKYLSDFEKIRKMGDEGRTRMLSLLEHERPDVRVMAATFLLRFAKNKAMAVLEEAKKNGMIAFGASEAIKRWNEGKWSLDLI